MDMITTDEERREMEDQIRFIVRQSVFPLIVMHPFIVYTLIAVMILHYRYCHLCFNNI